MTLQDLGSIGELVGAIAVILSLIYLAVQIRHSNKVARAQSRQTLLETYSGLTWDISLNPDLARIIAVGITRWPEMSNADKTTFDLAMGRFLSNLNNGLLLVEAGMLDQKILDEIANNMLMSLQMNGGANWWQDTAGAAPRVRKYLDGRLAHPPSLPPAGNQAVPHWAALADVETPGEGT